MHDLVTNLMKVDTELNERLVCLTENLHARASNFTCAASHIYNLYQVTLNHIFF